MLLGVPVQVNNSSSDNDYGHSSDNYATAGYAATAAHNPRARTGRTPRDYCTRYECLPSGPHVRPAFHNIAVTDEPDYLDQGDPDFSLCCWRRARQTPKPPQPPSKTCFPFLRLPAEIRNAIYRLVFVRPGTLQVLPTAGRYGPRHWLRHVKPGEPCSNLPVEIYPALLLVNRQIHCEAASIFYGENRFSFYFGPRITDGRVSLRAVTDRYPSCPFSMLSSANAKHLRRCEILIWLNINSDRGSEMRARYNTYQSWLAELASKIVEPGVDRSHALREVDIVFQDGCYSRDRGPPRPINRCHQFLLEPLATIYGVLRVNIKARMLGGFDAELVCAMTAKRRMVEPPKEDHGLVKYRRNRKVHWRRKKRFGRYHERRWNWLKQTKAVGEGSP
ncbi:MAG: hypothetical protein M1815_005558 [Lichina confinis]|nr:MAG: hypothetical protein M1815_005558 [Lichina confinis]